MRRSTTKRSGSVPVLGAVLAVGLVLGACASDTGSSGDALDEAQTLSRLAALCTDADVAFGSLTPPTDDPVTQGEWAGGVAAILEAQATDVRSLVVLDDDLRVDVRAFADNTAAQAAAWRELESLLGSGVDLDGDPRVGEFSQEIAELSLGRDDLSDELEVPECRRE